MSRDCSEIVVSALSGLGTTLYPDAAPQGVALPYVIYRIVRGTNPQDFAQSQNVHQQVVNFEVHSISRAASIAIMDSITGTLRGLRGSIASHVVQSFFPQGDYSHRRVSERDGTGRFRHIASFSQRVTFEEV